MATYQSAQVQDEMPIPSHGDASSTKTQRFKVDTSAALTTSDRLEFGYLPKYARVVDAILLATDIDTHGTATIALNVGDAGDADRLFAASTVGQAGTAARMTAVTGFGHRYDDETLIVGVPSTGAATGAAGSVTLIISYVIEDDGVGYPD